MSQTLVDIIRGLPNTNIASLVFALVSSLVLIVVKELSARYRHKLPFPVPMEIIIVRSLTQKSTRCLEFYTRLKVMIGACCCPLQVVVATAISGPLHLPEIYHMDIVGEIPLG